ncbi:LLM class flavin-dependent oxidoreductase [Allokutzneria sp. A3M-2-11 16]|uniref:LLM class flavin-dependent oxidoreductase n=1 Tax=Allokutzneria sp. A3M-2-11 16 TaxID=2962043 RepID=UPI0020B748C5|nr:LLM class flavin-dependent oxidoreductase [Allokutzneria sp. A3M-2-11 16]MCP3804349.1 LLM class flavin-dependent oxidoreductase [Allokutzneria sp. A3M-2-11 16]
MRYAINLPLFEEYANPRLIASLAQDAERAGWDGFFVCDHLVSDLVNPPPIGDPWITLAAVAAATERMRIGPIVTPLARRRPWKVARETVALDHLSGGRLTLGVGLGFPPELEFAKFGEDPSGRVRAAKLDEALEIVTGLWSGQPFSHSGEQFQVSEITFRPTPLQFPRIPIWVAGVWPRPRPFARAARWDGVVPMGDGLGYHEMMSVDSTREVIAAIQRQRTSDTAFDVVHWGSTPDGKTAVMDDYAEAGVTWWMETLAPWSYGWADEGPWPIEAMNERIRMGPRP